MQQRESDLARRRITSTGAGELLTTGEPARAPLTPGAAAQSSIVPARALPSLYLFLLAPSFPRTPPSQRQRGLVCAPFAAPDSNSLRGGQSARRLSRASARLHTGHSQVHAATCCIACYKSRHERGWNAVTVLSNALCAAASNRPLRLHECLHRIAPERWPKARNRPSIPLRAES
ncbi:hypothetical protein PSPO01_08721 [Paraphaeosphaeria sporulosa]